MGRIRLFPLFFQNGCSQSSRFLPQARRILGSRDENGEGQVDESGTAAILYLESSFLTAHGLNPTLIPAKLFQVFNEVGKSMP